VARAKSGEWASPELQPLLRQVYCAIVPMPVDLASLKNSLVALLEYLSGPGRTNANCWAVDMFFDLAEGWERNWTQQNLPDEFHDVLALMGEALHDTVPAPKVAQNFDCLPEQFLERARGLKTEEK